jgi:hypothetical protein
MEVLNLDSEFTLRSEKYNYVLKREQKTGVKSEKTGKEIISTDIWYFPKLSQALNKYMNESLKPCKKVLDLNEKVKQLEELITTKF